MTRRGHPDHRGARRRRPVQPGHRRPATSCSAPARRRSTRRPASSSRAGSRPETERVLRQPRRPCSTRPAAAGATSSRAPSSSPTWTTSRPMNAIYARFVHDPPPARSTVAVAACRRASWSRSRSSPTQPRAGRGRTVDTPNGPPIPSGTYLMTAQPARRPPIATGATHASRPAAGTTPREPPKSRSPCPAGRHDRGGPGGRPRDADALDDCPRCCTRCAAGRCWPTSSMPGRARRRRRCRRPRRSSSTRRRSTPSCRPSTDGRRSRSRTSRAGPATRSGPRLAAVPDDATEVLVLSGDVPLVTGGDLEAVLEARRADDAAIALASVYAADPGRSSAASSAATSGPSSGSSRPRTPRPRSSTATRSTPGLYAFDADVAAPADRHARRRRPSTGELYLTELVRLAREDGRIVSAVGFEDDGRFDGINDRAQLAAAEWSLRVRLNEAHMRDGVTMRDPSTVYLDWDVDLAADVTLEPNVILRGATSVGEGSVIGAGQPARRRDDRAERARSGRASSSVDRRGRGHASGRSATCAPAASSGEGAEVGNYAELKNTPLGAGSKQHHMSYLGDADVGERGQHRRRHDHRQLRRHPQAPDDHRRRGVHRRRHDAHRPDRPSARAPGPAPARSSPATSRRASSRSASRPGSASPGQNPRGREPTAERERAPVRRSSSRIIVVLRPAQRRLLGRPRSRSSRSAGAASQQLVDEGRARREAGPAPQAGPGPLPRRHPDRHQLPRVPRLGVRRRSAWSTASRPPLAGIRLPAGHRRARSR